MISAYENGRRQPSLPTLSRLVEATGTRLVVGLHTRHVLPDTVRGRLLRRLGPQLRAVAARHGVSGLRAFGSVVRGSDDETSDVDLLADTPPGFSLLALVALRRELSETLGEPVDVVPARSLRPEVAADAACGAVAL